MSFNWTAGDKITATRLNQIDSNTESRIGTNEHNILQLYLENFFANKVTPFLGLFFDGFSDTTKADINTNTTIDTANKKLDLDATFTSGVYESIVTSFQQSMKTAKLWIVRKAGTSNVNSIDLEKDSSQFLSITDAAQTGLDILGDITLEAWVNIESQPATDIVYGIISKRDSSPSGENSWILQYQDVSGTKKVSLFLFDAAAPIVNVNYIFIQTLTTGTWVHVAMTWKQSTGTAELFIDGVSQGTVVDTSAADINNSTTDFSIGRADAKVGLESFFDGKIDEVRVWDDIRTSTEISNNKDKQLVGNEANLQGYWRLNNDLLDETANNNDLTNNGGAVFSTDISPTFVGDKFNLDAAISVGATTLTIDGDQTGVFANGDTIDISTSDNLTRERKTLTAVPTFAAGKTTLTFSATANAFGITDFVERVNVIPQISLVDVGTAKSFQAMTYVRSELGTGIGSTGNGIAKNEVEDEYEFTAPTAQEDLKIKLDLTRNDTSLSVFAKRLGVVVNI